MIPTTRFSKSRFGAWIRLLAPMTVLTVLGGGLSACGKASGQAVGASDGSAAARLEVQGFEDYVARFEQAAASQGRSVQVRDLVIRFGRVDQGSESGGRGVCEYSSGSTPVVTVSKVAWDASSESEREQLIFHELGHCVLLKRHEGGVNSQGIPRSIMNPYRIDGSIYQQNKAYYLSGLFAE